MANLLELKDKLKNFFKYNVPQAAARVASNPTLNRVAQRIDAVPRGQRLSAIPPVAAYRAIKQNPQTLRMIDPFSIGAGGVYKASTTGTPTQRALSAAFPAIPAGRAIFSQAMGRQQPFISDVLPGIAGLAAEFAMPVPGTGKIAALTRTAKPATKLLTRIAQRGVPSALISGTLATTRAEKPSDIPKQFATGAGMGFVLGQVTGAFPGGKAPVKAMDKHAIFTNEQAKYAGRVMKEFEQTGKLTKDAWSDAWKLLKETGKLKGKKNIKEFMRSDDATVYAAIKNLMTSNQEYVFKDLAFGIRGKPTQASKGVHPFEKAMHKINRTEIEDLVAKKVIGKEKAQAKIPKLEVTKQAQDIADISVAGGGKGGKMGYARSLSSDIKSNFEDWVNLTRNDTRQVVGVSAKKPFIKYDSEGIKAFDKIQEGTKGFKDLRKYFDTKYNLVKESGIPLNYRKNYLPQLWDNTQEQIEKVFSKKLGTKPSFTLERIIEDYKTGIKGGLTPKFTKVSDLVGWYEGSVTKSVADKGFFDYLVKNSLIQPQGKAPAHWVTLTPDNFPKYQVRIDKNMYSGTYKAPPELAKAINNHLTQDTSLFKDIAGAVSTSKGIMLSSGVPGTGITFHTFNVGFRNMAASKNPLAALAKTAWWTLNPKAAAKSVNQRLPELERFVKAGMSATTEDQAFTQVARKVEGNLVKKGLFKMKNWQEKMFEENIFRKIIPAMKLDFAQNLEQQLIKKGVPKNQATKQVATMANEVFGGINTEALGRDRNLQNILRSTLLASDWMETNVKLGKGAIKAVTPGLRGSLNEAQKTVYTRVVQNMVLAYLGANVMNKAFSGKFMWENDKGNEFNIDTGQYTENGKKVYFRPFGTAADFIRLPYEIARDAMSGDFSTTFRSLKNRLSPAASVTIGALTDTDYRGRPIGWRGTDKYGNKIPVKERIGGIANELLSPITPAFVRSPINVATGRTSATEGLTEASELPFRYSGGVYSAAQKQAQELTGAKGKELYSLNQLLKGETKFSDRQMTALASGNVKIEDILGSREANRVETEIKNKLVEQGGSTVAGDKYWYFDENTGTAKSISLDFTIPTLKKIGVEELDKKALSKYKSELTALANRAYQLYELGVLKEEEALKIIQAVDTVYDATKKPKKPKGVTISKVSTKPVKLSKSTSSATRIQSIKIPKHPGIKKHTVKAIRIEGRSKTPYYKIKTYKNTLTQGFTKLA